MPESPLLSRKAPAFSLPDQDGKVRTLREFAGRTVVIYFYPKDDTPGCTRESCAFRDLSPALAKRDVVILGVSADSAASHAKFAKKFSLPFPLLADTEKTMIKAYGAWGTKSMYGKSHEGIVRSTVVIDATGKVVQHWTKVSGAEAHPAEVAEFIATLA
ncbi:MAG: peroxiredoxin [Kiritimatiellia bacterium]